MKKKLISILFALGVCFSVAAPAHAQSYGLYQDCQLQTATGQAVAGAQVYFLDQPANTTNLTPQAQVYSSSTGGTVTQPLTTNGYGECSAYLAPGLYTVVYVSPYTGTRVFPDQAVNLPSGGSGIAVNPITQITWPIASGSSLPSTLCPTDITGNLTSGSPTILAVSSFTDVFVGQEVTGTGIPAGTLIQSVNSSAGSITLTENATTTQTGVSLSFYSVGQPFQNTATNAEYFCSLNGWVDGVQQIVPGDHVTVSPSSGVGVVTINADGNPAPPVGSIQFNSAGGFGGVDADWNATTANFLTLGLVATSNASAWSCNGTDCTITAANSYVAGQTVILSGFGGGGGNTCLNSTVTPVLSTGLSTAQYEIVQSATSCSGTVSGTGGTTTGNFAGLMVNSGSYGVDLFAGNGAESPSLTNSQINLATSFPTGSSYQTGNINISTTGGGTATGEITLSTTNNGGAGGNNGDIMLNTTGNSGGGENVEINTNYTGNALNEESASFLVTLASTSASIGASDANVIFTQTSAQSGANFTIGLTGSNAPTLGNDATFSLTTNGKGPGSGDILLSATGSVSTDGKIAMTATGPVTFTGSNASLSSSGVLTVTSCTGCGSSAGTVTSFTAPSASWPSWLVPTVTNSTTTPSLTVVASAIPNSSLATQTANTLLGALSATTPSGLAVPSCSATGDALNWTSGTGFGCVTGLAPLANPTFTGTATIATGVVTGTLTIGTSAAGASEVFTGKAGLGYNWTASTEVMAGLQVSSGSGDGYLNLYDSGGIGIYGATPTVASGQLGLGTTTTASSSCGSLSGASGCLEINVGGTAHYIPYY